MHTDARRLLTALLVALPLAGCAAIEDRPEKPIALVPPPTDPGAAPWKPTVADGSAVRAGAVWAAASREHVVRPLQTASRSTANALSPTVLGLARSLSSVTTVEARTPGVYAGLASSNVAWARYCAEGAGMTAGDWQIVTTEGGLAHLPPLSFRATCRAPR